MAAVVTSTKSPLQREARSRPCAAAKTRSPIGFAWRKKKSRHTAQSWRETVTHYCPEPWLVALAHERARLALTRGALPAANR